jgi:hypothetical protein
VAYAGVVVGRLVKGVNAWVNSSVPFPTKNGASQESKGGTDERGPAEHPRNQVSKSGEGRHGDNCWRTLGRSPGPAKRQVGRPSSQPKVPTLRR